MPDDVEVVGRDVAAVLAEIAQYIQPFYPHHAEALFGEIVDTKLTNHRWNRSAAILASLSCVPGVFLCESEHDRRNIALDAVPLALKMAHAAFGGKNSDEALEFARWRSEEIRVRIGR